MVSFTDKVNIAPEFRAELDSCEYFYLREISEPRDNSLRLVLEVATVGSKVSEPKAPFSRAQPIRGTGQMFELLWDSCVAYLVQDECYARQDETGKVESGRLVRIYAKSRFLDDISKTTGATPEWPGPLLHVEVICLNHVIDVVATKPPQIRLAGAQPKQKPN